ncbi:hypothetical protein HKD37_19G054999 [Glycine soja]
MKMVSVSHCSSTKAIWSNLKKRFEQRNSPLIFHLKRDLVLLEQGSMPREISASVNVESSHAFVVKNGVDSKNKNVQKDCPTCVYYGIQDHMKAQCYKLVGYPPNYKKNESSSAFVNQLGLKIDGSLVTGFITGDVRVACQTLLGKTLPDKYFLWTPYDTPEIRSLINDVEISMIVGAKVSIICFAIVE